MTDDRRLDSSRSKAPERKAIRATGLILGIGLLILLSISLIAKPDLAGIHTSLEGQTHYQSTISRWLEKIGLPDNRERVKPLTKVSSTVSRAPIKTRIEAVPLYTEPARVKTSVSVRSGEPAKHRIDVVVLPRTRLASIPPELPKNMIYRDLEDRVEELKPKPTYTVAQRLVQYGDKARKRLKPYFKTAGVRYPAKAVVLVGLKKERRLELYAGKTRNDLKFIRHFPILAASGETGPKLKQGDEQVPEGLYRIVSLNPNSKFHLSLRVNYPNSFDVAMGKKDRRSKLGGDIMIHGDCVSEGCLAMGDEAAEDLFVLASDTGIRKIRLILSPIDFRTKDLPKAVDTEKRPKWTKKMYAKITMELEKLPLPPTSRTSELEEIFSAAFFRRTNKLFPLY